MRPSTLLSICILSMLLLSSAANATLVWTNPYSLSGGWGTNPTLNVELNIPQYDPSLYGGAELQAVRFDLRTEVYPFNFAILNPNDYSVYGLATVSGGFEIFDPSAPNTVFAETQHTVSQSVALNPWTMADFGGTDFARSDVGIITTNLTPFVGTFYTPVGVGIRSTDYSSWAGTEGAQLYAGLSGMASISFYYGYDDGTPARTPEPGTLLLMAAGLPALGFLRRKRQQ